MLAQVTYIQKFIMADSEDEFMPIFVAASAAFVAMSQRVCRPGVGRASPGLQYQTYLIPPADGVRASARRTIPGRCQEFWNSHNRCPADALRRPAGLVSSRLKAHGKSGILWCMAPLCLSVVLLRLALSSVRLSVCY